MAHLVVVAVSADTARAYADQRGREDAILLATGCRKAALPADVHPTSEEIVLLEGWQTGRYARLVEADLRRALGRRSARFENCQSSALAAA